MCVPTLGRTMHTTQVGWISAVRLEIFTPPGGRETDRRGLGSESQASENDVMSEWTRRSGWSGAGTSVGSHSRKPLLKTPTVATVSLQESIEPTNILDSLANVGLLQVLDGELGLLQHQPPLDRRVTGQQRRLVPTNRAVSAQCFCTWTGV